MWERRAEGEVRYAILVLNLAFGLPIQFCQGVTPGRTNSHVIRVAIRRQRPARENRCRAASARIVMSIIETASSRS